MIPEPSTLNWSSEKPTYDEAKGKKIALEWAHFGGKSISANIVYNRNGYNDIFDDSFTRYAIVADQPEPMELWGRPPALVLEEEPTYYLRYDWNCWIIETPGYDTKQEAVAAWNRIATAFEELGR